MADRGIRRCISVGAFVTLSLAAVLTPGVYPLLVEPSAARIITASRDEASARSPLTELPSELPMAVPSREDDQHQMEMAEAVAKQAPAEVTPRPEVERKRLIDASSPATTQVVTRSNATKVAIPPTVFTTNSVVQIHQGPPELERSDCFARGAIRQLAKSSHDQHEGWFCDPEPRIPIPVARPMLPQPRAARASTLGTGKGPNTKRLFAEKSG
jgi:hypothetical protein